MGNHARMPAAVPPSTAEVENLQVNVAREHFGRDKDFKTLFKGIEPKAFKGEGEDVPKELEEWLMAMDDYFALIGYNTLAQGLLGRAKLDGKVKLWWKLQCHSQGKTEASVGWGELKRNLKEHFLPLNYDTDKMNEFLSCVRRGRAIDVYYEDFVNLSRRSSHD